MSLFSCLSFLISQVFENHYRIRFIILTNDYLVHKGFQLIRDMEGVNIECYSLLYIQVIIAFSNVSKKCATEF